MQRKNELMKNCENVSGLREEQIFKITLKKKIIFYSQIITGGLGGAGRRDV